MRISRTKKLGFSVCAAVALMSMSSSVQAVAFTPGNLVITRVVGGPDGDATAALGGGGLANAVFVDEYTPAGVFVQTIPMPRTLSATAGSQRALTFSGTQNGEGAITLSQNGQYFILAGYNQTVLVSGTNASASTAVERVVGRIDQSGNVDTSTAFVDAVSNQSVRSAYSTNGTDIWIAGNGGNNVTVNAVPNITTSAVHYGQFGTTTGGNTLSTQLNTTGLTANMRVINVFNGRLFVTSGNTSSPNAPARGPDTYLNNPIPTTTGQTIASLPGFSTAAGPLPDDYWFKDDFTCYVADNRTDGVNGGIQKWTFNGGTGQWSLAYTMTSIANGLTTIGGTAAGVHGLTGIINGTGDAVLYGTTFDGTGANQSKVFTITDTGAASAFTTLVTSGTNSAFRGVEINVLPPIPEPASLALIGLAGCAFLSRRRSA